MQTGTRGSEGPALGSASTGKCAFFFSSRRRHTRWNCDWSSDVCSSDLFLLVPENRRRGAPRRGWRSLASPILHKISFSRRERRNSTLLPRTDSEGSMNPAIWLANIASAHREELKSFQIGRAHV